MQPDALALDIGANIGCTGLLLSTLARKVICFEPSPSTFALLRKNIAAGTSGNVEVVNAGLGRADANHEIVFHPSNRSGGFVTDQHLPGHTVEPIKILQGDSYILAAQLEQPVGFIKIDVEGFELDVIAGLAETIATHKPVVTLELNHWCLNAFRRMSVPDFLDALRARFPVLYAVGKTGAKNLHDPGDAYGVMHEHIVHFDYPAIVGAFDESQIADFLDRYVRNPPPVAEVPDPIAPLIAKIAALESSLAATENALQAERSARDSERASAASQLHALGAELGAEIAALRSSTSWKATAPLRLVKDWLS
ncbi:FkbM family methyltransferase [Variovorax sp. LjRoot84]|uniref:FkbM family methyltransferase n=1 Tax=Variovorax sp. LjRoot84 TaxID=3342340 RepID=UPI003ED1065E